MMGYAFNVVANCRVQFYLNKIFPANLPKLTANKTLQLLDLQDLRLHSAKLYTNPLKFHLSRHLVAVSGCNSALFPDNCNAYNYLFAEFSLFLRHIHNSVLIHR